MSGAISQTLFLPVSLQQVILLLLIITINFCHYIFNHITGTQLQEADLLMECIMLRDGLMVLPDSFTANDINAVIDYLCL